MSSFLKTNGTNGTEAAKKRSGNQTLSNVGSDEISVTQLSFSINSRTKGSVPPFITFLTISKNFRRWLPAAELPAVVTLNPPADGGLFCARVSVENSVQDTGLVAANEEAWAPPVEDTPGHATSLPRPPLSITPPWLLLPVTKQVASPGWRALELPGVICTPPKGTWGPRGRPPSGQRPGLGG